MRGIHGGWLLLGIVAALSGASRGSADAAASPGPADGAGARQGPADANAGKAARTRRPHPFEALRDYRIHLEYFPVGMVVPEGKLRLTNLIPMHPAGFRANEYSMYLGPTYGLGDGWEVSAGVTGAQRLGPGGEAIFYGLGLQKQLRKETRRLPAVSIAAYGMTGPHEHHSGSFYLVGSKQVWGDAARRRAIYLHGGLRYERFGSNDYGEGSGVRPFGALTVAASRHTYFTGEISPPQPWEVADVYALRATYLIHKSIGLSGGIRGDGYRTYPYIEVTF